jgi:hypothetical protein
LTYRLLGLTCHGVKDDSKVSAENETWKCDKEETEHEQWDSEKFSQKAFGHHLSIPYCAHRDESKPSGLGDTVKSRRIAIGVDEPGEVDVPRTALCKIDEGRENDEHQEDKEAKGKQGVFRTVDGDIHDFDGQQHLILIFEGSKDSEETECPENGEAEEDRGILLLGNFDVIG